LRRIRGAIGMGLIWGLGWAVVGGGIMEAFVDPHGKILDMWPQTLGIVGFFGGVAFSVVLGIVAARRRFDALSLPQFTVWGAVGGLLLGALGVATGGPLVVIAITTLGSAIAAPASLILARKAEGRRPKGKAEMSKSNR
jgi:hypothetical protein